MENIRIRSSRMRKEQNFKTGFKKWQSSADFYFFFLASPHRSIFKPCFPCLSFLEFPAPTPFFLASFSNAYFLLISPASHPFRTPNSRFFPAPIPIPLLPLLSWAPPPYSPTIGASCRHSYYLLILIVAKFLLSPLDWSATQLFTRPLSIGCENNRYRNTAMTLSPKQWSCVLGRTN